MCLTGRIGYIALLTCLAGALPPVLYNCLLSCHSSHVQVEANLCCKSVSIGPFPLWCIIVGFVLHTRLDDLAAYPSILSWKPVGDSVGFGLTGFLFSFSLQGFSCMVWVKNLGSKMLCVP